MAETLEREGIEVAGTLESSDDDLGSLRAAAFDASANLLVGVMVRIGEADHAMTVEVTLVAGARVFSATEPVTATDDVAAQGEPTEPVSIAAESATRAVLASWARRVLVEGSVSSVASPAVASSDHASVGVEAGEGATSESDAESQLDEVSRDYVTPTILGALGAALVGMGIYALLDGQCFERTSDGVCLRGDEPNLSVGIVSTVAGLIAVGGAVVWIALGAPSFSLPSIEVGMSPSAIRLRGTF